MTNDAKQIAWSDSYSSGVREVDEQHKVLLTILNALNRVAHVRLSERTAHHLLWEKLEELNEYAAFHFTTEEKLMEEHLAADSSMARHIVQHREYWVSIKEFKQRGPVDECNVLPLLTSFLNTWWLDHIQGTDKQMGKELNARGVH